MPARANPHEPNEPAGQKHEAAESEKAPGRSSAPAPHREDLAILIHEFLVPDVAQGQRPGPVARGTKLEPGAGLGVRAAQILEPRNALQPEVGPDRLGQPLPHALPEGFHAAAGAPQVHHIGNDEAHGVDAPRRAHDVHPAAVAGGIEAELGGKGGRLHPDGGWRPVAEPGEQ